MILGRNHICCIRRNVLTLILTTSFSISARTMATSSASSSHKLIKEGTTLILEPKRSSSSSTVLTNSSSNSTPTSNNADSLVILSHGLGDTAYGWIDTVAEFMGPQLRTTKFILPTAPTQPVTVNNGYAMPSWYDIERFARERGDGGMEKAKGIDKSEEIIKRYIQNAIDNGIPESRIIVAGFSQGGALSIFSGLRYPKRLGGIIVLSAYMPLADSIKPSPEALTTPILFCHGDEDMVVPLWLGEDSFKKTKELGCKDTDFQLIEGMAHGADPDEIRYVTAWISKQLHKSLSSSTATITTDGSSSNSSSTSTTESSGTSNI